MIFSKLIRTGLIGIMALTLCVGQGWALQTAPAAGEKPAVHASKSKVVQHKGKAAAHKGKKVSKPAKKTAKKKVAAHKAAPKHKVVKKAPAPAAPATPATPATPAAPAAEITPSSVKQNLFTTHKKILALSSPILVQESFFCKFI